MTEPLSVTQGKTTRAKSTTRAPASTRFSTSSRVTTTRYITTTSMTTYSSAGTTSTTMTHNLSTSTHEHEITQDSTPSKYKTVPTSSTLFKVSTKEMDIGSSPLKISSTQIPVFTTIRLLGTTFQEKNTTKFGQSINIRTSPIISTKQTETTHPVRSSPGVSTKITDSPSITTRQGKK